MEPYSKHQPTGFDRAGAFLDDRQDWLVSPVSQTRDSGPFDQSNFATLRKQLEHADPAGDMWEIHRFGHWGPGWYELLLVKPDSPAATVAQDAEDALADYPLLDEDDHSRREHELACEQWESMRVRDRVEAIQAHGRESTSIFAARRDELPDDDRLYEYLVSE